MKVKVTSGGFYYNFGARESGEVIDLPAPMARSWIANGLAEAVQTKRAKKGPSEATASGDAPVREKR